MAGGNPTRCPGCGRFGSESLGGYCKTCAPKEVPKEIIEICTKCGEPAFKFLDKSPYHSWYCEKHYNEKLEEIEEPRQYIVRDNVKPTNPFFKDEFVPIMNKVNLIKDKYGYEV